MPRFTQNGALAPFFIQRTEKAKALPHKKTSFLNINTLASPKKVTAQYQMQTWRTKKNKYQYLII
jgi:hypothetical protein